MCCVWVCVILFWSVDIYSGRFFYFCVIIFIPFLCFHQIDSSGSFLFICFLFIFRVILYFVIALVCVICGLYIF